jgi:predicted DCC family thiol-disulfide oxidoreductase YuxK
VVSSSESFAMGPSSSSSGPAFSARRQRSMLSQQMVSMSESSSESSSPKTASSSASKQTTAASDITWDWKKVSSEVFANGDTRPIILFDGHCNLCHGGVNFALDNDSVGEFRFVSLQSQIGKSLLMRAGKKPDDISSIVLVTSPTKAYFKSTAVLKISQKLNSTPLLPLLGTVGPLVPGPLRNFVYEVVANNRYRFGEREDSCRLDDERFDDRFIPDPEQ